MSFLAIFYQSFFGNNIEFWVWGLDRISQISRIFTGMPVNIRDNVDKKKINSKIKFKFLTFSRKNDCEEFEYLFQTN